MTTNITTSCYEDIWAALEALNLTVPASAFEEFLERYKRDCHELREKILREERALLKEIEEEKENIDVEKVNGMGKGKGKAIETAPSKPVKTPWPPNSYFIYRSCFVREVAKQKMKERLQEQKFKLGDGKSFAKVASLGWGALKNAGQAQQWVDAARVVDTEHRHIFPEYKYKSEASGRLPIARRRSKVEVVAEPVASPRSADLEEPVLRVANFLPGLYFRDEATTALAFTPVERVITMPEVNSNFGVRFEDLDYTS